MKKIIYIEIPPKNKLLIDNRKVTYYETGRGTPLLCLPGWATPTGMFFPLTIHLKDYFRLIMLDLPGFGGQTSSLKGRHTILSMACFVKEFVKKIKLKKHSVLGVSMGGTIALCYALLTEDRGNIRKIVSYASPYAPDKCTLINKSTLLASRVAEKSTFFRDFIYRLLIANPDHHIKNVLKNSYEIPKKEVMNNPFSDY